jgi:hypothetical protein
MASRPCAGDEVVEVGAGGDDVVNGALESDRPLTIIEAKHRLALTFGVKPENIKITVEA